jgi:hypothetical protein
VQSDSNFYIGISRRFIVINDFILYFTGFAIGSEARSKVMNNILYSCY